MPTTTPNLALNSPKHIEAKASNQEYLSWWERNVIDEYKTLSNDEIRAKLKDTAFPFSVCIENWQHDFNISSCIRNCNAFNARKIYYVGEKRFDRRGMKGVQNYSDIEWLPTIDKLVALKAQYRFVAIDNIANATPLNNYTWQANSLLVFGSEGVGITSKMLELCDDVVYIKQYGSVRSINVAAASAVIMNDIVSQFNRQVIK
jgi:tRNA G18 (ribose-2'-O)-methylase SpoU